MSTFKVGDLVRIVRQPLNVLVPLVGEVGFIDDLHRSIPDMVQVQTLKKDGTVGGCGSIHFDCLEPISDPEWVEAKREHDERLAKMFEAADARAKRYREAHAKLLKRLSEKYNLPENVVQSIYDEMAKGISTYEDPVC